MTTNSDFSAWTADDPDTWTVAQEDANNYITEHANGARIVSDNTSVLVMTQFYSGLTAGQNLRVDFTKSDHASGSIRIKITNTTEYAVTANIAGSDSNGTHTIYATLEDTSCTLSIYRDNAGSTDYVMNSVSVRESIP
jgi:hypothetical protein